MVDLEEIDPILFDHPYFLVPAGDSEGTLRAYRLLVETIGSQDRVALGRFVMRTKEYLVAVRARDGALALTTMLFHHEVREGKDIPTGGKKPTKESGWGRRQAQAQHDRAPRGSRILRPTSWTR